MGSFRRWLVVGTSGIACSAGLSCVETRDLFLAPSDAGTDAATAAIDFKTDPRHCGGMNHDCLGGGCVAGLCQPVILHDKISPLFFALDVENVFWLDPSDRHIARTKKDASEEVTIVRLATMAQPMGFAIDADNVYFGDLRGRIRRCKITGCVDPEEVASDASETIDLFVDDTRIYWLEAPSGTSTRVASVDKHATSTPKTILFEFASVGRQIRGDGGFVFVTAKDGAVRRAPKTGGGGEIVAQVTSFTGGLGFDETNVYFTETAETGAIYRTPKNATAAAPTSVVSSQFNPVGLALDRTNLYWVNGYRGASTKNGSLMMCAFASCGKRIDTLASELHVPLDVLIDEKAIYWLEADAEGTNGAIKKIAKP